MIKWSRSLTAAEYVTGLTAIAPRMTDVQRRLLVEQYHAPGRQVTSPQLAQLAEVEGGYSVVNALYGRLGRMFCDHTGEQPDVRQRGPNKGKEQMWTTWSAGRKSPDGFVWQMLPNVADALEQLGWVDPSGLPSPHKVNSADFDWQAEVRNWCQTRRGFTPALTDSIVAFFRQSFENTRCPDKAWFGIHSSGVSLVVGGIFLSAVHGTGSDQGLWLLLDQTPSPIEGVDYRQVKSSRDPDRPLIWAHAESLRVISDLVANAPLWASFQVASQRVFTASRSAADRDATQVQRGKRRLSEFWVAALTGIFPDEIAPDQVFREGAKRTIIVNAYERDERARAKCIAHFGRRCAVCTFSFGEAYGSIAQPIVHIHHLRPLSEIGEEYTVDPIEDLRPVCPNCHAVLHLRKPVPYSIQELRELLGGRIIRAVMSNQTTRGKLLS